MASNFEFGFPIGILGQVWYLIVSTPDLCTLTYFVLMKMSILIIFDIKADLRYFYPIEINDY